VAKGSVRIEGGTVERGINEAFGHAVIGFLPLRVFRFVTTFAAFRASVLCEDGSLAFQHRQVSARRRRVAAGVFRARGTSPFRD
jgi:hypothetical protein